MSHHPLKRKIKPAVPELILNQANSDLERYMLEQASIGGQQNEVIIETLLKVEEQTTKTNGRVNRHEELHAKHHSEIKKVQEFIADFNRVKKFIFKAVGALSLLGPLFYLLLDHFFTWASEHWFK